MTTQFAEERLSQYLKCEKIEYKAFEREVVEDILLNSDFEQVCDSELKKLWKSIPCECH